MARAPIDDGLFVDQEWHHKRWFQIVTVRNIYRKDRAVRVVNSEGVQYVVPIRNLRDNFYPLTIYIPPSDGKTT